MAEPPPVSGAPPRRDLWLPVLFSGLAGVILLVSVSFQPEALPRVAACHFYALTGLPCPGCGLTRAFCAIGHGQWGAAWRYNPFGYVFYLATLGLLVLPWVWPRLAGPRRWLGQARWLAWLPLLLAVAMVAYNFYRWAGLAQRGGWLP